MALSYRTRKTLRILLPIVFWLSAGAALTLPVLFEILTTRALFFGLCAALASWSSVFVVLQVDRHQYNASEEAFLGTFFVALGSFFCPMILGFIPVLWVLIIMRKSWDLQAFSASILGWIAAAMLLLPALWWLQLPYPWMHFLEPEQLWPLLPLGLFWLCYLASTIARKNLRER